METLKKLWTRFLRYLDEVYEREHQYDLPTRKEIRERIAVAEKLREEVREAARRAGVVQ